MTVLTVLTNDCFDVLTRVLVGVFEVLSVFHDFHDFHDFQCFPPNGQF